MGDGRLKGMVLGAALAMTACDSGPPEGGYPGRGIIQSVNPDAGTVTIDHGDIPGLMKGMTMTFHVSDPALLEGVSLRQEVDFGVVEEGGRYVLVRIQAVPWPAPGARRRGGTRAPGMRR